MNGDQAKACVQRLAANYADSNRFPPQRAEELVRYFCSLPVEAGDRLVDLAQRRFEYLPRIYHLDQLVAELGLRPRSDIEKMKTEIRRELQNVVDTRNGRRSEEHHTTLLAVVRDTRRYWRVELVDGMRDADPDFAASFEARLEALDAIEHDITGEYPAPHPVDSAAARERAEQGAGT